MGVASGHGNFSLEDGNYIEYPTYKGLGSVKQLKYVNK